MWNLKPNPLFDSRTIPIQLIIIDYIYGLGPSYTTQYFFNRMLILKTFSIKIKVMDVPPNSKVQTEFLIIVALFLSSHY